VRKHFFGRGFVLPSIGKEYSSIENFPSPHELHDPPRPIPAAIYFLVCHALTLCDELNDFSSLSAGLWATTMGLTGHVSVPVLKMFHPLSDAASTHADVPVCTLKSHVII
jgi:hypothetical protein